MLSEGYEPGFDRDYEYGRPSELALDGLLEGLKRGDLRAENKRKRMRDTTFYVEVEQNAFGRGEWKPSGISITTADVWAIEIDDTGVFVLVSVARLRRAVELRVGRWKECGGSNPTRGWLVHLAQIVSTRCD